jgi:hypothetical protein
MDQLSRHCGIFNVSQPYGPPRPITGMALLFCAICIVCNVSFTVCVAFCAVFSLTVVCCFVLYVYLRVVSYCSTNVIG